LIARHKDLQDGSVPSGNSMAAYAFLRLGKLTGRNDLLDAAQQTLHIALGLMERAPAAAGQMLLAADLAVGPSQELAFVGPAAADVSRTLRSRFLPRTVVAWRETAAAHGPLDELFAGRSSGGQGELALSVCENFACQAPVVGKAAILERIKTL
jgi:uncharacterized protein